MMKNLESHITAIIHEKLKRDGWSIPLDYFSWGRDSRHIVDNTERLPSLTSQKQFVRKAVRKLGYFIMGLINYRKGILSRFRNRYALFDKSYQLMSDQYSSNLFAELILMKLVSEKNMRLSSFTQYFIDSYENASEQILSSNEMLPVYSWILRKITLDSPPISFFTVPTVLNLHYTGRLYRYQRGDALIEVEGPYDYIFNLSALKHVRSEKDPFTLMRMLDVNIFNTIKTIRIAKTMKSKNYFCVSTDKAANPVNMMGASKRIMEMFLMRESLEQNMSMARFANVAFSDGSLLHGFNQRLSKHQPISAPNDVTRYFVTPQESGELCLMSGLLGENRDIFFPKLSEKLHLITFSEIATEKC